jgi:hypothetical protein
MTTPQIDAPPEDEPTIGRLIADTTRDFSALIRNEIELAKTELKVSVKAGGISVVLFLAAVFLLLLSIIMASIAFALFLNWLFFGIATSFIIVFGVYVLVAGLLVFVGVKKIKQVKAPEHTIETVKDTKQVFSHR